ncbi:MAG TPA: spore germination protein [Symbiobacteriaceae bacterium]|jgi:spore germination protein KA
MANEPWNGEPLDTVLQANLTRLREVFDACPDLIIREFLLPDGRRGGVLYVNGLIDVDRLDRDLLHPLVAAPPRPPQWEHGMPAPGLPLPGGQLLGRMGEVVQKILDGVVVLLLDGETAAQAFGIPGGKARNITEPVTERSLRGPKEGFVEDLQTNLSLLRRIIKTPRLKVEEGLAGRLTRTNIALVYIQGLVRPGVLDEVRSRLGRIQIDGVLDSGYLEEFIEDHPYSLFPQILDTQRPDVVAAHLLEGRFAILCAGSPNALLAPIQLWSFLQSVEDYYERYLISSLLRILRFSFAAVSVLLPALYVSVIAFHHELIPTALVMTVARAREGVPFPAVVEALLMEVAFEALREAGIRLPASIGPTVSIVGALIIGEAAVRAGIVSAPAVIIVSTTGIASFVIPRIGAVNAVRMLRFLMLLFAGAFGLYGITIMSLFVLIHLASMRSFGAPYLSPWTTLRLWEWLDLFIRAPRWIERRRITVAAAGGPLRQGPHLKPGRASDRDGNKQD